MSHAARMRSGFLRRFWKNQKGATTAIFAMALVPIIGIMGFSIDVSYALQVKRALQASTDAAVLAGALDISNGTGDPVATAKLYSAAAGGKNLIPNLTVTATVTAKCFTSTGASCSGPSGANGLVVQQQTNVPTFFSKIFGFTSFPVSVTSTAGAAGAKPQPLNVMLVLDDTVSMGQSDPNCSIKGDTKLQCALVGVQTLLGILAPSVDQVGLMVFPGVTASSASYATDCNSNTYPTSVAYSANPTYQLVAPSSDYRSSDTAKSLANGSSLVNAVGGGTNCTGAGLTPTHNGQGTFFADAIWQAQGTLAATAKSGMQNVIVILSDGDAGSGTTSSKSCPANSSAWCTGNEAANQCHEAVKAAQGAHAAGTWVFSIAYYASNTTGCSTDSPKISPCLTMTDIASDTGKFYSDTAACPSTTASLTDLVAIFETIGQALQQPRLLPNDTA